MFSELKKIIDESKNIVFFGGAGVSTESGIPDFRSEKGLYNAVENYGRSPEELISYSFFRRYPETFYEYYRDNLIYQDVKPNKAHIALAELEGQGKLSAIVTQNIDGLHQLAGSKNVFELHGSVLKNYCMDCGAKYDLDHIMNRDWPVPLCSKCGGIVRPDVILYEEALDDKVMTGAVNAISKADTLIVGGTSLVVYPAADLINYFRGKNLVLINKSSTQYDSRAKLIISEPIGEVLGAVVLD